MRYFSYHNLTEDGGHSIATVSEEEIRKAYWPHWKERMKKAGHPTQDFTFEDCLDDWVLNNWAWIVEDK